MKTFIVRLEVGIDGRAEGIVERVRTGEKQRFRGYGMLAEVVQRMAAADDAGPPRSTLRLRDCGSGAAPAGAK